jgi:hypothetical protein
MGTNRLLIVLIVFLSSCTTMEVVTDTLIVVGVTTAGAALGGPLGAAAAVAITYPLVDNSNNVELIDDLIENRGTISPYGSLWDEFYNLIIALIVLLVIIKREALIYKPIRTYKSLKPKIKRFLE